MRAREREPCSRANFHSHLLDKKATGKYKEEGEKAKEEEEKQETNAWETISHKDSRAVTMHSI